MEYTWPICLICPHLMSYFHSVPAEMFNFKMLATNSNLICVNHTNIQQTKGKEGGCFETSAYRLYNVLFAMLFFFMAVKQVTMRRYLVKLITGIGTDRKKKYKMRVLSNWQYLKEMSLTMMYGMHARKSRIRCQALTEVIIQHKVRHKWSRTTLSKLQSCKPFSSKQ